MTTNASEEGWRDGRKICLRKKAPVSDINKRIDLLASHRRISRTEIATRLGIPPTSFNRQMRFLELKANMLVPIAEILECSTDWLLYGAEQDDGA